MQWLWLTAGILLLLAGGILTWLLRHAAGTGANAASSPGRFVRLHPDSRTMRLIRQILRRPALSKDTEVLQDVSRPLMTHLMRINRELRSLPPLPAGPDGEPRLMELARDAADHGQFAAQDLITALTSWDEPHATSGEVAAFPLCIALAQCHRLTSVLRTMQQDDRERQAAAKLARRLQRCKRPEAVMEKNSLSTIGLSALLGALREQEQHQLLALTDAWLESHEVSAEALVLTGTQRQVQLAEEIRLSLACFDALVRLDWPAHCSEADDLHALLLQEPSGVYARMTTASQLQLRRQIGHVSRHVRMPESAVVRQAFILCGEAQERSLEKYIGYWFQDADGLAALHHALPTRQGWIYAHTALRRDRLAYGLLWCFGAASGILFLQGGQPVFMLPFFALTTGCVVRTIVNRLPAPRLPALALSPGDPDMRTLVVLHAVLHDPHEAIRAVRRLKTARQALPEENVDFLLLGDFSPAITAVSSGDLPIIQAASATLAALNAGSRVMYIQRGRAWDSEHHLYGPRAGWRGVVSEICRLIAQGECEDVIAFATMEAASFERRYAYVLALPAGIQPAHGLLDRLLQVMAHPLCQRYPTAQGYRGHAILLPEESPMLEGTALIRPDAFLEATDSLLPEHADSAALCGELCGQARAHGAHIQPPLQDDSWAGQYDRATKAWQLLRWQLPWVQTPGGMIGNPLSFWSRFRLRELLRRTLVPLGQCALLLWAILTQDWLLLLLAFWAPEFGASPRRWEQLLTLLCRMSLLPTRMSVNAAAIIQALRRRTSQIPDWTSFQVWVQGIAATLLAALAFVQPAFALPALAVSVLFALFPLAQRFLDAPVLPTDPITDEHIALLDSVGLASWRFFENHVDENIRFLPPCSVQFEPALGPESATSPEAIGGYLLACVSAKDVGHISAQEAARRIRQTVESAVGLPMPCGLPCRRYALPSLTVQDPRVDARSVGFFLAALMTTAQALRTWLPELPEEYASLSAHVTALADALDLSRLYDHEAARFHAALDENGQGMGSLSTYADERLLLSVAACARRDVPPEHFARLDRICAALHSGDVPLSQHGTASAHLLAGLFLPLNERDAIHFIRAMAARGRDGLFGQDSCGYFAFDPAMRYRLAVFGIPEIALSPTTIGPVYAPHAAALCLPYAPRQASEALARFRDSGALGPEGFCDAVDLTKGAALVGLQTACHQGLILAAAADILADSPIRRYFCALPEVEACLPLLRPATPALVLPALRLRRRPAANPPHPERAAQLLTHPADTHLIGTAEFRLLANANGASRIHDGNVPLTRLASRNGELEGIQFYLADEGRVYRLGSPLLQGHVTFSPGEVRYEHLCGSIKTELVCTADTVRRRALHVVTITNLSTRDRVIDLADFLLPGLNVSASALSPERPEKGHLQLHARGTNVTLHHTLSTNLSPLAMGTITDAAAFLGRSGSLHRPASLEEPLHDQVEATPDPCLSFRVRLSLGSRGLACVWFTTSLNDTAPPQLAELPGVRRLAALQHEAITDAAGLSLEQARLASRLSGPICNADGKVSCVLDDHFLPDVLQDLLAITGWFHLHGLPMEVYTPCSGDAAAAVEDALHGRLAEEHFHLQESADRSLLLRGDMPLREQLDTMYTPLALPPAEAQRPIPALLPRKELLHRGTYGGFDPETLDYIIELEPGQTTPVAWENAHLSRHFSEMVDECGFRSPFREQVWLQMEDGMLLSPWSSELPRAIRMGAGETSWEAWSDKLDVRLSASILPGHRCGLRILRLRNASEQPVSLRIAVQAQLSNQGAPLESAPGLVLTNDETRRLQAFLAGDGWTARRTTASTLDAFTDQPRLDLPDSPQGTSALLTCEITLAPEASGKAVWVTGHARHGEDVARALDAVKSSGTTGLLRAVRSTWAERMGRLTFDTPEDTLTLLMNRILPLQSIAAVGDAGVPALIHLDSTEAKRALLRAALNAENRDEWARLALLTAEYVRVTQDNTLTDVRLPHQNETLYACCRNALLSLPLDRLGLPLGEEQARRCFLYASAAQALDNLRPDEDLRETGRKLLNAADTSLWQEGFYGEPLRLDVQALACLAYGANPRTRQAIHTCWAALYDRPHGLIRRQEATDAPPLPGLPGNGGMITQDAAIFLQALLQTGQTDEAFELLRALNPLHHTDDAVRLETFRCSPYQLHGGMCAAPLEAGRAIPEGGDEAAALLYAVVLTKVLGFHREGSIIRMEPHVPQDWEEYTVTLREGASTWRISVERRTTVLTVDGDEVGGSEFTIRDDGKIHRVHIPLT